MGDLLRLMDEQIKLWLTKVEKANLDVFGSINKYLWNLCYTYIVLGIGEGMLGRKMSGLQRSIDMIFVLLKERSWTQTCENSFLPL